MTDCIFCKIVAGEEPASIIYEDKDFMVIMDAYPLAKGHVLVIPKEHKQFLHDLSDRKKARLFKLGNSIIDAQRACNMGKHGTNMLLNDGKAANQTVPHIHLHLIPRSAGDIITAIPKLLLHITGVFGIRSKKAILDEQAAQIANQLDW